MTQWKKFLSSSANKMKLISFLGEQFKSEQYRKQLAQKELYITDNEKCFKLSSAGWHRVSELNSAQEEVDTRLLLHARHAGLNGISNIIIHSPDIDVYIFSIAHLEDIGSRLYLKTGVGNKARIVCINDIVQKLALKVRDVDASIHDHCNAILGVYCFTGCDTISAMVGKGKLKALKILSEKKLFVDAFNKLGQCWELDNELAADLEKFVCRLYGHKLSSVNELRYKMYCSKNGKIESEMLPPCQNALKQHMLRANYQSAVWRRALESNPIYPSIEDHGWKMTTTKRIEIQWMTCRPAPVEVLDLLSCDCKHGCQPEKCSCLTNILKCTDLCGCEECENVAIDIYDKNNKSDEESDDDEDEGEKEIR